jgi:hypothetical protein
MERPVTRHLQGTVAVETTATATAIAAAVASSTSADIGDSVQHHDMLRQGACPQQRRAREPDAYNTSGPTSVSACSSVEPFRGRCTPSRVRAGGRRCTPCPDRHYPQGPLSRTPSVQDVWAGSCCPRTRRWAVPHGSAKYWTSLPLRSDCRSNYGREVLRRKATTPSCFDLEL